MDEETQAQTNGDEGETPESPTLETNTITAKGKKDEVEHTITVSYDFGDSLEESVDLFGGAIVHAKFKASAKIDAQAKIRRDVAAGKDANEIQASFLSWKPGMPVERKTRDPEEVLIGKWRDMSEDDRANMLRRLRAAE